MLTDCATLLARRCYARHVDASRDIIYDEVMKTLSIQCPDGLAERLEHLVREGWVADPQQAVVEALRRFLDSHRPELTESQVLADVEWGLHGED